MYSILIFDEPILTTLGDYEFYQTSRQYLHEHVTPGSPYDVYVAGTASAKVLTLLLSTPVEPTPYKPIQEVGQLVLIFTLLNPGESILYSLSQLKRTM